MNYFELVGPSLLRHAPELLGWLVGVILVLRMLRRGGGKAEKLFLAGCSLMFAVRIISLLLDNMVPWMREQGMGAQGIGTIYSLVSGMPSLAGFVCLVFAYWVRFRTKRQESV